MRTFYRISVEKGQTCGLPSAKAHVQRYTQEIAGRFFQFFAAICQQTSVYPYPLVAGSARPNPKMGAPDPENPLFLGFSVLRGGPRPWSETMVSEGARPWGGGRSRDCEFAIFFTWCWEIQSLVSIVLRISRDHCDRISKTCCAILC